MARRVPSYSSLVALDTAPNEGNNLPSPFTMPGKPGKVSFSNYLGRGAFGAVYSGKYGFLKVAIKIYKNLPSHKPFLREVDCLVRVGCHPHVMSILGFGTYQPDAPCSPNSMSVACKNSFFMISEYVGSSTLRSLMADYTTGQLVFHEKARICLELLQGLDHIHQRGVAHHDIKPENILISETGAHATIADFGMATIQGVHSAEFRKQGKGTVNYAPPEAFTDTMSELSDLWTMGVLFFEWLSHGELPFYGKHENDLRNSIKHNDPCAFNDRYSVPDRWQYIVTKVMLNKNPQQRWPAHKIYDYLTVGDPSKPISTLEETDLYSNPANVLLQMRNIFVKDFPEEESNNKTQTHRPTQGRTHTVSNSTTTPQMSTATSGKLQTPVAATKPTATLPTQSRHATMPTLTAPTMTRSTIPTPVTQPTRTNTITISEKRPEISTNASSKAGTGSNDMVVSRHALPPSNSNSAPSYNIRKRRNDDYFHSDTKRRKPNMNDMILSSVTKNN